MSSSRPEEVSQDRWLVWTLVSAVVAFALGVWGLAEYLPGEQSTLDLVYHSLQLFVLGSDPLSGGSGAYPVPLEIARFLAPATTIYGIFRIARTILRVRLQRRAIARASGHTVVTGDSPSSLVLAGNLRAGGSKVVFVGNDDTEVARRQGIPVVRGDPCEVTTLHAAGLRGADVLIACAPETSTNAAVVLAAGAVGGRTRRLDALARVSSNELVEALRIRQVSLTTRGSRVAIDFFSLEDIAARELVRRYEPLPASIGIVGFGRFGQALLRALVRHPESAQAAQPIIVYHADDHEISGLLPPADQAPGRAIEVSRRSELTGPVVPPWVFVCLESEDEALRTALSLSRTIADRVVLCLHRESPFGQALQETPSLDIFGIFDASCTRSRITEDAIIGRAARAIHQRYVEACRRQGQTVESNHSMKPWAELPVNLQESNYAQAEHIGAKLVEIDCTLAPIRSDEPKFDWLPGEVERLARLEHDRWRCERQAAGVLQGDDRSANQHPDLVDWSALSDDSRRKDIDAVRYLPDLLADAGITIARRR